MRAILIALLLAWNSSWPQNEGFATAPDGTPVYYRTFGNGEPLLIINGGPGMNSNGFEGLAQRLGKSGKAIIYDQRGTGKSALERISAKNITLDLMVQDIEALREHLKIQEWTVLGHSFGGMLASYYATRHPERIKKMILSSSGGIDLQLLTMGSLIESKLDQRHRDSLAYWNRRISDGDHSYAARLGRGRAMAPAYVENPKFYPVIAERLTQTNRELNTLVWQDMNARHFDCAPQLSSFGKPVLIIQGKQDIVSGRLAEKAHSVLKNSSVVLLDNCSHYGWLDAENEYFDAIGKFLKS